MPFTEHRAIVAAHQHNEINNCEELVDEPRGQKRFKIADERPQEPAITDHVTRVSYTLIF